MNISAANNQGWVPLSSDCDPNLGLIYNYQSAGPSTSYPVTLYYTSAGEIAGIGVENYGAVPDNLNQLGFWQTVTDGSQYHLTVMFYDSSVICNSRKFQKLKKNRKETWGNSLVINPDTIQYSLPTTESDASTGNWTVGSCFAGMGHHWFYDLKSAPVMSWDSTQLLPIVTMFSNGVINAIFFTTTTVQQSVFGAHWWEPVPLTNSLMCHNFCDPDCTFTGTSFWSTMHIYFNDWNPSTCNSDGCTLSCCP